MFTERKFLHQKFFKTGFVPHCDCCEGKLETLTRTPCKRLKPKRNITNPKSIMIFMGGFFSLLIPWILTHDYWMPEVGNIDFWKSPEPRAACMKMLLLLQLFQDVCWGTGCPLFSCTGVEAKAVYCLNLFPVWRNIWGSQLRWNQVFCKKLQLNGGGINQY